MLYGTCQYCGHVRNFILNLPVYFLQNAINIRKLRTIVKSGEAARPYHFVNLLLRFFCSVRMQCDHEQEGKNACHSLIEYDERTPPSTH